MRKINWHEYPYAEVIKTPLATATGLRSKGSSVLVIPPETFEGDKAPYEAGLVHENYNLIPNNEIRDMQNEIVGGFENGFQETSVLFNGRTYARVMVRNEEIPKSKVIGQPVRQGVLAMNSYDGSSTARLQPFLEVVSCLNGMTSKKYFPELSFRHNRSTPFSKVRQQYIDKLGDLMGNSENFIRAIEAMQREVTIEEFQKVLSRKEFTSLGISIFGDIVKNIFTEFEKVGKPTLWGMMQGSTGILWHGFTDDKKVARLSANTGVVDAIVEYVN